MSNIKKCFIRKNTPELRSALDKLGYKPLRIFMTNEYLRTGVTVWTNKDKTWKEPYYQTVSKDDIQNLINNN